MKSEYLDVWVVPAPVIGANVSGISCEGQETSRNSPFLWLPVKDGNAAKRDIHNGPTA